MLSKGMKTEITYRKNGSVWVRIPIPHSYIVSVTTSFVLALVSG